MTDKTQKTNSVRQNLNHFLRKEDGFSFIEVIIVIAMILILSAILIPSYLGFVETAREANAKISAQNMYTVVQMAKLTLEDESEDKEKLYSKLKELNPALLGINAVVFQNGDNTQYVSSWKPGLGSDVNFGEDSSMDSVEVSPFTDNTCVISTIDTTENGFSFTYYQYLNGTVYVVEFDSGSISNTESFKHVPPA